MSVKHRLQKLEKKRGGRGRMYRFEKSYGMDSHAIKEEFCREHGIEPEENDLFIFLINFCDPEPLWKYLDEGN